MATGFTPLRPLVARLGILGFLGRVRLAFLIIALVNVGWSALDVARHGAGSALTTALLCLGVLALGALWLRGFRRHRFSLALEPAEVAAILAVGLVVGEEVRTLLYPALFYRSLFGGRAWRRCAPCSTSA